MPETLVIQSHRSPLPYPWLEQCLDSVRHWCEHNRFSYRFLDDALFNHLPAELLEKVKPQKMIAADLARLNVLQHALNQEADVVVWLDADFLIFNTENFQLPDTPYAVGREVWVQKEKTNALKVYKKVHNAFLMFRQGNSFLPFYAETAERLLRQNIGSMPPQFIGPKLLTALHNVTQLPVMESAGMLSPLVIRDIVEGGGDALRLFLQNSSSPVAGVNLCISSREKDDVSCAEMEKLIDILQNSEYPSLHP